jgi:hypothetical protein
MAGIIVGAKIVGMKILEAKLQAAFETWARFEVNDYFRDQFLTEKWDYPGVTFRKNGETVGPGPRDIYDLGELYKSGVKSFVTTDDTNGVTASWDWDAKNSSEKLYAYYVHEGQGTNVAPRRWTDALASPSVFLSSNLSKSLKARITTALRR